MTTDDDAAFKVRENRIRRMAHRQGLILEKTRRRDPRAIDYGTYALVRAEAPGGHWRSRELVAGGLGLDEVEAILTGETDPT